MTWLGRCSALVATLGSQAAGCGEAVSLDEIRANATASTGSESTTGGASLATEGTSSDGAEAGGGDLPSDVPVEPEGVCAPGCDLELRQQWRWVGESPDENRREWSPNTFAAMTKWFDGSIFITEQRGLEAWVTKLGPEGLHEWTEPLELFCDCVVVSMSPSTFGDIAFVAQGVESYSPTFLTLGRFDQWGTASAWFNYLALGPIEDPPPRVGSIIPMKDDFGTAGLVGMLVIEPEYPPSRPELENVKVFVSDAFNIFDFQGYEVDTQPRTHGGTAPVGVRMGNEMGVAFPATTGEQEQGYAVWLDASSLAARDPQPLPGIPEDVAAGNQGRLIVLSRAASPPGQVELHLQALAPDLPPSWEAVRVVDTDVVGRARLVVDFEGRPIVAVPVVLERDGEVERSVELIAFEADGAGWWRRTVPVAAESAVELELANDGSLVLATTVSDHLHAEALLPTCVCDE